MRLVFEKISLPRQQSNSSYCTALYLHPNAFHAGTVSSSVGLAGILAGCSFRQQCNCQNWRGCDMEKEKCPAIYHVFHYTKLALCGHHGAEQKQENIQLTFNPTCRGPPFFRLGMINALFLYLLKFCNVTKNEQMSNSTLASIVSLEKVIKGEMDLISSVLREVAQRSSSSKLAVYVEQNMYVNFP